MFSAAVSISLATTLAFHPFAVDHMMARVAPPPATSSAKTTSAAPPPPSSSTTTPPPSDTTQPGWDDEPVAPPPDKGTTPSTWDSAAGTTAPAPAPTVDEKTAPPAAEADAKTGEPLHEVARPRTHKGIGLIVGASVAGATAWGLAIAKVALANKCNDSIDNASSTSDAQVTLWTCFTNIKSILGLSIGGMFVNWAAWGLAGAAGGVRGKHDGVGYAWDGKPDHAAGGFIGGGAAMLGVGLVGVGLSRALALTKILKCDVTDPNLNDCVTKGFRGYFLGVQISSSLVAAGLGMLVYGAVYRKNRNQFEDRRAKVSDVRLVPDVNVMRGAGTGYAGMALSGRF